MSFTIMNVLFHLNVDFRSQILFPAIFVAFSGNSVSWATIAKILNDDDFSLLVKTDVQKVCISRLFALVS